MAYTLIASADYHQAADCLPENARGRQCVPCSLLFLITAEYIKSVERMSSDDMNDILHAGSKLYCAMSCGQLMTNDFIHPEELPKRIVYKKHKVSIIHEQVISGLLRDDKEPSLHRAILDSCICSHLLILVFSGVSIGIFFDGQTFHIYDSHSRNSCGRNSVDGVSVLGHVFTLVELVKYLHSLAESLGRNISEEQFDLHSYKFRKTLYKDIEYAIEIFDNEPGFNIHHIRRKRRHTDIDVQDKSVSDLIRGRSFLNVIDDVHVSHKENSIVAHFHKTVSAGPDYVCSCCTQMFFRHNVIDAVKLQGTTQVRFLSNICSVDSREWVCLGCWKAIKKEKIPQFWINNGLQFPSKPAQLQLSDLEERLVSPRLPFMQLRELPRGGQLNLKGNVVNVPADVNNTIKSLPRMLNENETIMLKLKRKLSYKHHVAFENIRPNKVYEAAQWLVENSCLFRREGIVINETWLQQPYTNLTVEEENIHDAAEVSSMDDASAKSDCWTEDDNFNDRPTGNTDTCLQPMDFREFNQVLCVAPGENNSPLGIFQDLHSEILSFPTLFCGKQRAENRERLVPLHYSSICKWELRNVDRRVAQSIPNIFYKLKKLQIKQIRDKVSLAVRKCKLQGQALTAGKLLTPGFVDNLTMQNDGYRVLRTLRGSPPYWEQAKRDLFAMIRQIGIPTWFCSFSAAETKWEPLLKSLAKQVNGVDLTNEQVKTLSWLEKCKLIKSDPVTCARYFDFRFQAFVRDVLKNPLKPIGEIIDYFYRIEFQQRGSPHVHMLIWIKNAPVHGTDMDSDITSFVDKYVTCKKDSTISELVNYQTHRHASTCRKRGKNQCRFNFPIFPMPKTTLLYPLQSDANTSECAKNAEKITQVLNELYKSEIDYTFDSFLECLEMDMSTYLKAVQSTISRSKLFLKRSVTDSRVNNYNKLLIKSWMANMDLQYVLDAYSCVSYIVSYISKGQRGLSNLLRDACSEAQKHDSDIKQQVRRIGNQFLSSVEIGAQEAVYLVLQIPLRKCTRDVVYVDTKQQTERTSMIKPAAQLKDLPPTSREVEMDNMLKRYKRRPKSLEMLCYADFAAWYDLCYQKSKKKDIERNAGLSEELPEIDYEYDRDDEIEPCTSIEYDGVIRYPCGTVIRKRRQKKVLYTHIINVNENPEEHYRQKLMLYTPWRNENDDLLCGFETFEESYRVREDDVLHISKQYEKCNVNDLTHVLDDEDDAHTVEVDSEAQSRNAEDACEGSVKADSCFDPGIGMQNLNNYDIGNDIGLTTRSVGCDILPQKEVDNIQFLQEVRVLNKEQKYFFYYVMSRVKTETTPFYTFLSGGAGVGKSVVIRCIYQMLLKYFNHKRNENPDTVKLLLCAPTGKAAHNIGGSTVHSAFCIPANQGFHFKPLDTQQLNAMQARFHCLKLVIIDEISMVGRNMFNFINLRLQEIMGCTKPFGGVSILAVGDLFQLKPVMDSWIFSQTFSSLQMSSLATNLWIELFEFFELKVIMRQKDDQVFAELLNRLREGKHSMEDLQALLSRKVESNNKDLQQVPHLFCGRQDSIEHNFSVLQRVDALKRITVEAIDDISGDIGTELRHTILARIPDDTNLTMGLQKNLALGIDLPAEICVNVDTEDGLTNGASCCIKKFDFRVEGSRRCSIVWVLFDDDSIGQRWRIKYQHLYLDNIHPLWTPILETSRRFCYRYFKTYLIVRRQFPICLSAGKTIHKAQGSTMKAAVLNFGKRKIDHIYYVGLSRVTCLSNVYITQMNDDKICVSKEVQAEMERLRKHKRIVGLPMFNSFPCGITTICFQNCRSLQKHFDDIKLEHNIMSADLIGFAETRLWCPLDKKFSLQGFNVIAGSRDKSVHGLVIYYKQGFSVHSHCFRNIGGIEYCLLQIKGGILLAYIYCPPKSVSVANLSQFLSSLSTDVSHNMLTDAYQGLVLMGDFNFDWFENKSLRRIFKDAYHLKQLVTNVTSDYGSCIDHIYTNLKKDDIFSSGTLESYYSDHKPLFLAIV